ncbi:unnamed protein product, partial [Penicillium egyptiacum]
TLARLFVVWTTRVGSVLVRLCGPRGDCVLVRVYGPGWWVIEGMGDDAAGAGVLGDDAAGAGVLGDDTAGAGVLADDAAGAGALDDDTAGAGVLGDD